MHIIERKGEESMKSFMVVTVTLAVLLRIPLGSAWATPVPIIAFLDFAAPGQPILFSALGSFDTAPARSLISFDWNFGDGSSAHTLDAHMPVTHSFSQFGTYNVELLVTNDISEQVSRFRPALIILGNHAPLANAGEPYVVTAGNGVTLDGSASTDPDLAAGDAIVSYQWDTNNDGHFGDATGALPTLTGAFVNALGVGDHPIALRVADSLGFTGVTSSLLTVTSAPTTVPEPTATGLLMIALAGLAVVCRMRQWGRESSAAPRLEAA
jgi:PKD domain